MTNSLAPLSGTPDLAFVVDLEGFNGPLDLLLHLVREDEINIASIPIARIADQFLALQHAPEQQSNDYQHDRDFDQWFADRHGDRLLDRRANHVH